MKTVCTWNIGSIVGKIMMGLVLAAMIGSADAIPAFAKDDHKEMGRHDNGRRDQRGRGYDRDRYEHGRRVYYPDRSSERYYAPPRVIYEPPAPPGIGIFLPPIFIR